MQIVSFLEKICMKCQSLFSEKNKKKIFQNVTTDYQSLSYCPMLFRWRWGFDNIDVEKASNMFLEHQENTPI